MGNSNKIWEWFKWNVIAGPIWTFWLLLVMIGLLYGFLIARAMYWL